MKRSTLVASLGALTLSLLLGASCATDDGAPPAHPGTQPAVAEPAPATSPETSRPLDGGLPARSAPERIVDVPSAPVSTAFIYNRVLAKLERPDEVDLEALKRDVETRTGAEVKEIRKGPMGLLSILFEETSPPRGEDEQRALVEQLKQIPELRYAEPERLLQAR